MAQLEEPTDKDGLAVDKNSCPHVYDAIKQPTDLDLQIRLAIPNPICSTTHCDKSECWLCLQCHRILCGRHMMEHYAIYESTDMSHCMAMSIKNLSFWCYKCEDYINHLSVKKVWGFYSRAHMAKFNKPVPKGSYSKTTFAKSAALLELYEKKEEFNNYSRINVQKNVNTSSKTIDIIDDLLNKFSIQVKFGCKRTALFYHTDCLLHKPENCSFHVERPERCSTSYKMLGEYGLLKDLIEIEVREATVNELMGSHSRNYVEIVFENDGESGWFDGDTFYNEYSCRAAKLAAGATIDLMTGISQGKFDNGYALVRPPGHHCEHNKAMGFCLFNNAVIASNCVRKQGLCKKIFIVDWDIHHGNGTQNMFYDEQNILYFSVHRHDEGFFYPGTGKIKESGNGFNINVPFNVTFSPQGYGNKEYLLIWKDILLPICREFKPDIILVSSGYDACVGDPLGGQNITPPCYGLLTRLLLNECDKVAIVLEGGYNLDTMPRAICCCNYALLKGPKQQKDNFDVDEFYTEFKEYITDGGNGCEYEAFHKWFEDYGDQLIDIDYNPIMKIYNQNSQNVMNIDDEDISNYGSCKRTIKEVLDEQKKYWKCIGDILKKYTNINIINEETKIQQL